MISYVGGEKLRPDQYKVVQAYLEEKHFNDRQHFSSALEEYLEEQPSVGRQTLDLTRQDLIRSD